MLAAATKRQAAHQHAQAVAAALEHCICWRRPLNSFLLLAVQLAHAGAAVLCSAVGAAMVCRAALGVLRSNFMGEVRMLRLPACSCTAGCFDEVHSWGEGEWFKCCRACILSPCLYVCCL